MNYLPTHKTDSRNLDNEFAIFWANFDPNYRYNETTKAFIRQVWEVARNLNRQL